MIQTCRSGMSISQRRANVAARISYSSTSLKDDDALWDEFGDKADLMKRVAAVARTVLFPPV